MATMTTTLKLNADADAVWAVIGGFDALPDWQPAVKRSELLEGGAVRRLFMADGGTIVQRLIEHNDAGRFHTYSMGESHLPVAGYVSTLRVVAEGAAACHIEWTCEFDPLGVSDDEAKAIIRGIHRRGLANLEQRFG